MRHILLAVTGLSPQVITETLYGLFHEGRPVAAVHVITTGQGAGEIYRTLLAPAGGPLEEFCREYSIDRQSIVFSSDTLHVLTRETGTAMHDITCEDDNEIVLATCLRLAHRFTADPDSAVSFLVAGGRKTMTSCLTLAAQLYGRAQDRLYHVLVSPEFENCRNFWFPPRESRLLQLTDPNGEIFYKETRYARISLVPIPFVSIRDRLDSGLLDRPRPPAELMQALVRTAPKQLTVDLVAGKIIYGTVEMDLHPARLALYCFFAERKARCHYEQPCGACTECWVEVTEIIEDRRVRDLYCRIPAARVTENMGEGSIRRLTQETFRSYRSKINRDLRRSLGAAALADLEISSAGDRPDTRYGLRIDKNRIEVNFP